jgi:hypothetical protein
VHKHLGKLQGEDKAIMAEAAAQLATSEHDSRFCSTLLSTLEGSQQGNGHLEGLTAARAVAAVTRARAGTLLHMLFQRDN